MWSHQHLAPPESEGTIHPKLILSGEAADMIAAYVTSSPATEVNGFAYVTQTGPNTFYLASASDVFITDQVVTEGSAEADGTGYALAVDSAVVAGRADALRLQWHSHPGASFFSPTDRGNIENFGRAGAEWFISVVTNRQGELRARLDLFRPIRFGAEMAVEVVRTLDPAMVERATTDIAAHVTVFRPKVGRRRGRNRPTTPTN